MFNQLAPRERKLVALALLVAAIALLQFLIVGPLVAGFQTRADRRAALLVQYQHNARTIASVPRLRRAAERQAVEVARYTLAAPSTELASQRLQERLRTTVEGVGGEFRSSVDVPAPAGLVGASADTRLTLAQLTAVLARLQNEAPYLTVESLNVAADEALLNGQLNPLDAKIEISVPHSPATTR